jgi:hypothetical protein
LAHSHAVGARPNPSKTAKALRRAGRAMDEAHGFRLREPAQKRPATRGEAQRADGECELVGSRTSLRSNEGRPRLEG